MRKQLESELSLSRLNCYLHFICADCDSSNCTNRSLLVGLDEPTNHLHYFKQDPFMNFSYIAKASVNINCSPTKIWEALTDPELIKQYLFGTEVTTNWMVGSPITYKGFWNGQSYEDKGIILEIVPDKTLISSYWSSMAGLEDVPENYKTVKYELSKVGNLTTLTITQDNNSTQEEADHSKQNWDIVLSGIKKLVEK